MTTKVASIKLITIYNIKFLIKVDKLTSLSKNLLINLRLSNIAL